MTDEALAKIAMHFFALGCKAAGARVDELRVEEVDGKLTMIGVIVRPSEATTVDCTISE